MTQAELDRAAEIRDLATKFAHGNGSPSMHLDAAWREIERLGLAEHIAQIDARGYALIPPEKVGPLDFPERLREKILDVAQRRTGTRPDLHTASEQGGTPFGYMATYLLFEDPIFQEALLHPVALALVDYYLGRSATVSVFQAFVKGPGGYELPLHTDNVMIPAPYPAYEQFLNVTWLLTDYNEANGATCFVPGSNHFGRAPSPGEGLDQRVAAEGVAGSMLVWPGSTWHGGLVRQTPGLRIPLSMIYGRMYLVTQEPFGPDVTQDILDRNPARFATLMGRSSAFGYRAEGIDFAKVSNLPGKSLWD